MILLPRHRLYRQPQGAVEVDRSTNFGRRVRQFWLPQSYGTNNNASFQPSTVGVVKRGTGLSQNVTIPYVMNGTEEYWAIAAIVSANYANAGARAVVAVLDGARTVQLRLSQFNQQVQFAIDSSVRANTADTPLVAGEFFAVVAARTVNALTLHVRNLSQGWVNSGTLAGASSSRALTSGSIQIGSDANGGINGYHADESVAMFALIGGLVTDDDARAYLKEPWQLFRAPQRRLYVQVGGGTSTRTVTAAGGFDLGGTSNLLRQVARAASGGIDLGGTAAQARVVARVPSGGFDLGGVAPALRYRVSTGSGGIDLGGTAPAVGFRGITVEGDGGIAIGGEVIPLRYRTVSADGGIALGGTAAVSFVGGAITARVIRVVIPGGGVRSYTI